MEVRNISGVNNLSVFYYNNKKFFFFGDLHNQNKNSCDQTQQCDHFNYHFTNVESYNSTCTTIGPMLIYWFTYNRNHDIQTDFLLEESMVEKNKKRTYYATYNKVMARRRHDNVNVLSTIFPFDNMSWMALTASILQPCFNNNKLCDFAPTIKFHAVDIRALDGDRVSPFALNFLEEAIDDYRPSLIIHDVIYIIQSLLLNNHLILSAMMDENGYATLIDVFQTIISPLSKSIKSLYQKQWDLMSPMFLIKNIKMHRLAVTMSKLDNAMANRIKTFILRLAKDYTQPLLSQFDSLVLKYTKYFNDEDETQQRDTLQLLLNHAMNHFTVLSAYMMDAYVLTKIFLAQGDEVIVYTGAYHIEIYNLFFKQFVDPVIETPTYEHQKCIYIDTLPEILPIQTYRDYYYKM